MTDLATPVAPAGSHDDGPRVALATASDASLVSAIAERRHDAFTELYRRHGAAVAGVARTLFGAGRAEEVVQEVFLRLWDEPGRFDPARGPLRAYLSMQVRGRGVDAIRSDASRRAREAGDVRPHRGAGADVEAAALAQVRAVEARRLVEALPERERIAIILAFYGDCSYRQVAGLLGEPEGTVKARIRSGLSRVRAQLPDDRG